LTLIRVCCVRVAPWFQVDKRDSDDWTRDDEGPGDGGGGGGGGGEQQYGGLSDRAADRDPLLATAVPGLESRARSDGGGGGAGIGGGGGGGGGGSSGGGEGSEQGSEARARSPRPEASTLDKIVDIFL